MVYKVLISDPLPEEAQRILEESPEIEVIEKYEDYQDLLGEIHGWVVRSGTQVTAADLALAKQLRCVCRAGAGVDNVDLVAASAHDVIVMNTPGANSRAAAELTIALMMSLARNISFAYKRMTEGGWDRSKFVGAEVSGKRLGVLGLGRVGRHVVQMAQGLGMEVLGYDPILSRDQAKELGVELLGLDELLPQVDYLALHTPLNDETRGLINRERLASCKPGVRIINCSRGGVLDEEALLVAMDEGHVAGAALDVFSVEPLPADSPLRSQPNLIVTPHLGASTHEAQLGVATQSAAQIRDYLEKGEAINVVNPK